MTGDIPRPALVPTPETAEFWRAARLGRLLLQRCQRCGGVQHYPRALCARCWHDGLEWFEASGMGSVWTYTVVHRPGHPAWQAHVPYVLAIVELDEGPWVVTNVLDVPCEEVSVGMRVRLALPVRDDGAPLQFVPATNADDSGEHR